MNECELCDISKFSVETTEGSLEGDIRSKMCDNMEKDPEFRIIIIGRRRMIIRQGVVRVVFSNESPSGRLSGKFRNTNVERFSGELGVPTVSVVGKSQNDLEKCPVYEYSPMPVPTINDIALFSKCNEKPKKGKLVDKRANEDGRTTNGKKNEVRESIIEMLSNLPEQYAEDARWIELRDKFMKTVSAFSPYSNYTFRIIKKGGRRFSYDFDFVYTKCEDQSISSVENIETTTCKMEFKYSNTSTIDKIPQIYQKSCNTTRIFSEDTELYSTYYYKNGLLRYRNTDDMIRVPIPTLEEYVKKCGSNESLHPFFVEMKSRQDNNVSEKSAVVDSTIEEYIRICVDSIELDKVSDILRETQTDKTYLLWNYNTLEFHIGRIPADELTITRVITTTKNTIVFQANRYKYHFLLRWKNRKGILNPAWQVSLET